MTQEEMKSCDTFPQHMTHEYEIPIINVISMLVNVYIKCPRALIKEVFSGVLTQRA